MIACEAHTCHSYRVLSSINRILTCPRRPNARMTLMSHWPSTANLNIADPTSSRFAKMRVHTARTIQRKESAVPSEDSHNLFFQRKGKRSRRGWSFHRGVFLPAQKTVRSTDTFHWTFHYQFFGYMYAMWSRDVYLYPEF
jgi:hypothetical protein